MQAEKKFFEKIFVPHAKKSIFGKKIFVGSLSYWAIWASELEKFREKISPIFLPLVKYGNFFYTKNVTMTRFSRLKTGHAKREARAARFQAEICVIPTVFV